MFIPNLFMLTILNRKKHLDKIFKYLLINNTNEVK